MLKNKIKRLAKESTIFFQCDIQARHLEKVYHFDSVVTVAIMMAKMASILKIPLIISEHNRAVFGGTIQPIPEYYPPGVSIFDKLSFSMITKEAKKLLENYPERKSAVLYGVDTHVCVKQTAHDLLALGYDVYIPVDGVSSLRTGDRSGALVMLEETGVIITSAESIAFEMVRDASNPDFKAILPILKMDRSNQITHL